MLHLVGYFLNYTMMHGTMNFQFKPQLQGRN